MRDLLSLVMKLVQRLPEKQRTVVVACVLDGLSHTEAAERLGLPCGTVKSRLRTGIATVNPFEQLVPTDDPVPIPNQINEEIEDAPLDWNLPAALGDLKSKWIDFEIVEPKRAAPFLTHDFDDESVAAALPHVQQRVQLPAS